MINEDGIPEINFNRSAKLIKVIDGDTFDIEVDLGWSLKIKERIRLSYVDTPEIKNRKEEKKAGIFVRDEVIKWLEGEPNLVVISIAYKRVGQVKGKYGRTIADLYHVDEKWLLSQRLLKEGLGWKADIKGNIKGPRDLSLLKGIPKKFF